MEKIIHTRSLKLSTGCHQAMRAARRFDALRGKVGLY